jgi:putative ABC transport system permease protein
MRSLWQDIRFGARMLAKQPGFTCIAVLTLALGIGANAGIFSVLRQVLLQRLPVPHPEQLVLVYSPGPKNGHVSSDQSGTEGSESFSYPMYTDLRGRNTVFAGLAAKADFPVSVTFHGQTERAQADLVSGNYFETLGAHAALGRALEPADSKTPGSSPVVMLGFGYWKRRFASDPAVLNQSVLINSTPMTVVGVVQPEFDGIQPGFVPDVYVPITMKAVVTPGWDGLSDHKDYWAKVIGRLKAGLSKEQAAAGIAPLYRALLENELPLNTGMSDATKAEFVAKKLVLRDGARGRPNLEDGTGSQLLALMGLVAIVLFIACANVAGLLTARGAARQREIGVRLSLGATRAQLIRQLVVEACLLSVAGASVGLLIANWTSSGLVKFATENDIAHGLSASLNGWVLTFTVSLAVLCGILFGVAPALRATRVDVVSTLKEQSGALSVSMSHTRLRRALVVSQVALALLLITGAGGFVRSLYNLKHVDLGFRPMHVLQFAVAPQLNGYDKPRILAFYERLEERIAALPGVVSLSGAEEPLIADSDWGSNITAEGEPPDVAGTRHVLRNGIGPGHFSNLGIPLLKGREFTRRDGADAPKVAVVNESMAKTFFRDGDALGRRIRFGRGSQPPDIEIIGVVKDSHHSGVKEEPKPFVYQPYAQTKELGGLHYYVRTAQEPSVLAGAVRQAVSEMDSSLPVFDVRSFEQQIETRLSGDQLVALLATIFGALAALLSAMGIYGLLAYTVTQRTREIGVRMALGAEPQRIGIMIGKEVSVLIGLGILLGLPLAYALGRFVASMLYQVRVFEALSVTGALLALALVAVVAAYLPAKRATRVDPLVALRYE